MRKSRAIAWIVLTAALTALAPACIKAKYSFTIYPDGSGMVQMTSMFSGDNDLFGSFLDILEELQTEKEIGAYRKEMEIAMFQQVSEQLQGFAAWTQPSIERTEVEIARIATSS